MRFPHDLLRIRPHTLLRLTQIPPVAIRAATAMVEAREGELGLGEQAVREEEGLAERELAAVVVAAVLVGVRAAECPPVAVPAVGGLPEEYPAVR